VIKYSKAEILEALNNTDNNVAFSSDLIKKAKNNPYLTRRISELKQNGEKLRNTKTLSIPFSLFKKFEIDGDRAEYEYSDVGYFVRRNKLQTFALLSWLYGDEADISALEDVIWAICDEYTWALPAHLGGTGLSFLQSEGYTIDLFAAETGQALSEIISMLGDKLAPIVVARAKKEIKERILDRAFCDYWWKHATNNWASVCSSCLGMTAIYECDDNEELTNIILVTLDALENFFSGFSDDGACLEGLSYWNYGFGYFVSFAELLMRRTKGRINLFLEDGIKEIATFPYKCFFYGGRTVSFSDGETRGLMPYWLYSYLSTVYTDMPKLDEGLIELGYQITGCFRFASELRNYTFGELNVCSSHKNGNSTYILPDAEWYISTGCGISIAAKGGHNKEPHNHNDVGSFLIYKNGEEILLDVGRGQYTKSYFSSERYNIFCNSSRSHNVPIIDGKYQIPGKDSRSKDTIITEQGITTEFSSAYDVKELRSLRRTIQFDKSSGVITLVDSFEFENEAKNVIERFVCSVMPEILDDRVMIKNGKEIVCIYFDKALKPVITYETDFDHMGNERLNYLVDFSIISKAKSFTARFTIC